MSWGLTGKTIGGMKPKQMAKILIRILGLSVVVHGIPGLQVIFTACSIRALR